MSTETNTVEKVYESHTQYLSRRGSAMSGMIGMLSARLEIIEMNLKFDMQYDNMNVDLWRRTAKENRVSILETLIKFQHEWAEMQEYKEGDYGLEMYTKKIADYTTELEALKTLVV